MECGWNVCGIDFSQNHPEMLMNLHQYLIALGCLKVSTDKRITICVPEAQNTGRLIKKAQSNTNKTLQCGYQSFGSNIIGKHEDFSLSRRAQEEDFEDASLNDNQMDFETEVERSFGIINVTQKQKLLLDMSENTNHEWLLLTGGPGTGKTLIQQMMVYKLAKNSRRKKIFVIADGRDHLKWQQFVDSKEIADIVDIIPINENKYLDRYLGAAIRGDIHLFIDGVVPLKGLELAAEKAAEKKRFLLSSVMTTPSARGQSTSFSQNRKTIICLARDESQGLDGKFSRKMPQNLSHSPMIESHFNIFSLEDQLRSSYEIYSIVNALREAEKKSRLLQIGKAELNNPFWAENYRQGISFYSSRIKVWTFHATSLHSELRKIKTKVATCGKEFRESGLNKIGFIPMYMDPNMRCTWNYKFGLPKNDWDIVVPKWYRPTREFPALVVFVQDICAQHFTGRQMWRLWQSYRRLCTIFSRARFSLVVVIGDTIFEILSKAIPEFLDPQLVEVNIL